MSERIAKQSNSRSRGKPPALRPALRLSVNAAAGGEHGTFLARHLKRAHAMLRAPLRELSLALVGNRRMSELHEQFMNMPGPTDVLTFPLDEDERGRIVSGEVVVCVPEARRIAREHGVALRNELLLYALHGMLHLCGHDDRTAGGYRKMHQAEDRILTALGIGPTFKPDAAASRARSGTRRPATPRRRATAKRSRA